MTDLISRESVIKELNELRRYVPFPSYKDVFDIIMKAKAIEQGEAILLNNMSNSSEHVKAYIRQQMPDISKELVALMTKPISQNEQQEAVAEIVCDPMFLPALKVPLVVWKADIVKFRIGTELYTSPPKQIPAVTSYDLASEEDETVYWLQSDIQKKGWGPFKTEIDAWKYLFGREPSEEEIAEYKNADWYVGFINASPTNTEVGE